MNYVHFYHDNVFYQLFLLHSNLLKDIYYIIVVFVDVYAKKCQIRNLNSVLDFCLSFPAVFFSIFLAHLG